MCKLFNSCVKSFHARFRTERYGCQKDGKEDCHGEEPLPETADVIALANR